MSKMIAFQVPALGRKFERVEREIPKPGFKEALIKVHACGVCHSDAFTVEGVPAAQLLEPAQYPRIPGHEVIGTVLELGEYVEGWSVGDRVGLGWFGGSCGYCHNCRRAEPFACLNGPGGTGFTRDGGYATHVLADVSAMVHVPADLDPVESAPLLCAGITTFNALRNCGARPGDLVAIQGVGGLGHLAIQYAARLGFRIVALDLGREKEEFARQLGAHHYIDAATENPSEKLLALGGAMAILAIAPNNEAMEAIHFGLRPNGTMMLFASGSFPIDVGNLVLKRGTIKGWFSGMAPDCEDAIAFSQLHGISPIIETYPFEKAQEAYDRMMSGQARYRVVLTMD